MQGQAAHLCWRNFSIASAQMIRQAASGSSRNSSLRVREMSTMVATARLCRNCVTAKATMTMPSSFAWNCKARKLCLKPRTC